MFPIISFGFPIHNKLTYLDRSFGSIFSSTFINFCEIVSVDAFSDDGSYEDQIELAKNQKNISVIRMNAPTTSNLARIIAVQNSKGEYMWFVDPDDEIKPEIWAILTNPTNRLQKSLFSRGNFTIIGEKKIARYFVENSYIWALWRYLIKREIYLKAITLVMITKVVDNEKIRLSY